MTKNKTPLILIVAWCGSLVLAFFVGKQFGGGEGAGIPRGESKGVVMNTPKGVRPSAEGGESSVNAGGSNQGESADGAESIDVPRLIATIRAQFGGGAEMMNPTAMMKAMAPMADLSEAQVREALQEVEATSNQEFKASVLGAYERGELAISVPRLTRLARFYSVPVDQVLPGDEGPAFGRHPMVDRGQREVGTAYLAVGQLERLERLW